jgi:uncharacterized protein YdiU (UPF0061 family)
MTRKNPLLTLNYDPALERLGNDFYDIVTAAEFPAHHLRFRNDDLLSILGADPQSVTDADFVEAFGKFRGTHPFLALRYHGYQFGEYNPRLGDGRGFLYGQVRGADHLLYDLGTKGSGTTPYSRGGDGRLTLKGGVREVIAAEALHRAGVTTSRCLSLIETGEGLWRGDEPSPTRSSVMIRMQRSHIRFGTFERLHFLQRKDLIAILLDHVIEQYYPHLVEMSDRYALFYAELVQRVAELAAQWMAAGFCHAVLNTDNMAITGESFDYGPFAFIPTLDPGFTAAYFDHYGRYSYGRQPAICLENLQLLQAPLARLIDQSDLDAGLENFWQSYDRAYQQRMLNKLGFDQIESSETNELIQLTIQFLQASQISYHDFFAQLTQTFSSNWREDAEQIFTEVKITNDALAERWQRWKILYFGLLLNLSESEIEQMPDRLNQHNPTTVPTRSFIEAVWQAIDESDNWTPFSELVEKIRA